MAETWVINESPMVNIVDEFVIRFVSNGSTFNTFNFIKQGSGWAPVYLLYDETIAWGTVDLIWTNQAYRTVTFETAPTDALLTWLQANATKQESTSKLSIDLTTLPGWASLSTGSHNITIVAKADGYRDSEPSAAVSVTKGTQEYTDCITFTGESSDFTLAVGGTKDWDGIVEYSTDHDTWTVWDGSAISSSDKKLYLRGSGNTKFYKSRGGSGAKFVLSARTACSGNLNTLLEYSNPPTTLGTNCYHNMFYNCTNLTAAPELPALTLSSGCYQMMFYNCTNLTATPKLPATALALSCYDGMFRDCKGLTTATELPATTLADSCYTFMFYNCTALKISITQSPEYPTVWRIPSSGTISSTASDWNTSMLSGTGGTFTSDPSINTTYYGAWKTATNLISFTIEGTSYQAEEGMTWEEWCNSSYNTGGFYVHNNRISTTGTNFISTKNIQSTEYAEYSTNVIAKETVYYLPSLNTTPPSGGGGGVGN